VDLPNAFIGKVQKPSDAELAAALGASAPLWKSLIHDVEADLGVVKEEWKGVYPNKYGWALRLQQKGRNIVYFSPCSGCFRVAFVLSDKAVHAAQEAKLPKAVAQALATAPHYPEGTGLRLMVSGRGDLPAIRKLAKIKQAN
jgi:hypothetical protein